MVNSNRYFSALICMDPTLKCFGTLQIRFLQVYFSITSITAVVQYFV